MKKLLLLLLFPLYAWGQTNDANLKAVQIDPKIRNVTTSSGITKGAVSDVLQEIVNSKRSRIEANTTSGTNTYTTTISWVTGYSFGLNFKLTFNSGNTGASTLNINTLGAVAIKKHGGAALVSGDIASGDAVEMFYDGVNFQAQLGSGGGGSTAWSSVTGTPTTLSGYGITDAQPLDADLTTIAGLTPTTNNFIVSNASAWASRTPTQVKTTLAIANTDVSGLGTLSTLNSINNSNWSGTALADGNIASAATWNAKQSAITFGTGVQPALGVNIGSAGAFTTFNGAHGTPSSITLTNAIGLPPTTGISGWPANPGATRLLQIDASNNYSWVTSGSGGTVTSVGLTLPSYLSVTPSSITTSGTFAVTSTGTKLSDFGITEGVKKRIGDIYNTTLIAGSSSSYTVINPNSTFTFTSGGLTTSGSNITNPVNYVYYTGYVTNVNKYARSIKVTGTSDGNGEGVGLHAANGDVVGRILMTGASKGELFIDTYTASGTVLTNRANSGATLLSYSNSTDVIELTFERVNMNFIVTARTIDGSGTTTGTPVSINWTDPLTDGGVRTIVASSQPAIYHYGGSQTITADKFTINEFVQPDLLIYGNSIAYGTNCNSATNTFGYKLNGAVNNGVAIVAGVGNLTNDMLLLLPEITSLKPKVCLFTDGINDVFNSISPATTQANILTFINTCFKNGILPVLCTITHVTSGWTGSISNATAKANITSLNSFMTGLGYVKVIDIDAAVSTAQVLNSANASADGYHLSGVGHQLVALTIANGLRDILNVQFSPNSTDSNLFYDQVNGYLGVGSTSQVLNEVLQVRKDQNAGTRAYIVNNTSGTGAFSQLQITKSSAGTTSLSLSDLSAGFTTANIFVANSSVVSSNSTAGLNIGETASAPVTFWSNNSERARFLSTGEFLVGSTSAANAEFSSFTKNQNALTSVDINNSTSGTAGAARFVMRPNSGTFAFAAYSDLFTTSGISEQGKSVIASGQTNGFNIGTTVNTSLGFWTNNTSKMTLSSAGNLTVGATNNIVGVSTNNNATAGNIGESVSSLVATGSAVSLTTATAANVTSISLTAGDWDVEGLVNYKETTSTVTARSASTGSTSATLATDGTEGNNGVQSTVTSEVNTVTLPPKRFSLSGTTTVYLVAQATFSAGTCAAYGYITARRLR